MGPITFSNDNFVNWTKFEQNPIKIKRFEIFIAGTPDSQRTFGKIHFKACRVVKSSWLHEFISCKGTKLPESVETLKIPPLWKKLWPLEVEVKKKLFLAKILKKHFFQLFSPFKKCQNLAFFRKHTGRFDQKTVQKRENSENLNKI